ncbi:MAG: penicillin-binding protein 1C [Anaerolineae bacterium]
MKRTHRVGRLTALSIAGLLLLALGATGAWLTRPLPADLILSAHVAPVGVITAQDGRPLFELIDENGGVYRPAAPEEIPQALRDAVVATEDARFYQHGGVDVWAILRAAHANVVSGHIVSGASTITQQAARNVLLDEEERQERTLWRKLREAILALRLERTLEKDDILTLYLNTAYYGRLATGVAAAAEAYFAKPLADLSLAECAFLAGLPQAPALYDPATEPQAAQARRHTVLDLMVASGYLTEEKAALAMAQPLAFAPHRLPLEAPHLVALVREEVEQLVPADELRRGGLVVETTLDLDLQRTTEEAVRRQLQELNQPEPGRSDRIVEHAAVVVLDVQDGGVLTLVGSPDYAASDAGAVNGALSLRQPGSAIKPLLYLAAFEHGYLPSTMLLDVKTAFQTLDGSPYVPENYDLRYHGPVLARTALACSYNAAAVRLADEIGVDALVEMGRRLGIRSWDDLPGRDLALALGAGELSLWELSQAYGTLARGGARLSAHAISRIYAADGRLLYQANDVSQEPLVDPMAAYLVTHVLADDSARSPAFGAGGVLALPFPAAVKTGTTTDWRDNWTVGYSTERVVGVWVGNADGTPMEHASGLTGAAPIWRDVMVAAHRQDPGPFEQPAGLVKVEVCALSGQLPGPGCTHRRVELFPEAAVPATTCEMHRLIVVDTRTGLPADEETPPDRLGQRVVTLWPAEAQAWAADEGLLSSSALVSLASVASVDEKRPQGRESLLRWLQPATGTRYHLSQELPPDAQQVELVLAVAMAESAGNAEETVTVLWNGEPWATLEEAPYRVRWQLVEGHHCFVAKASDATGQVSRTSPLCLDVLSDEWR